MAVGEPVSDSHEEPCAICGKASDFKALFGVGSRQKAGYSTGAAVEPPPDGETLGNHTWTFLHTMAAYYPTNPSSQV